MRTLLLAVLLATTTVTAPIGAQAAGAPRMTVFKSPTCGCCANWVEHMKKAGFVLTVNDVPNMSEVKAANHVPPDLASCHTALVNGYVIEGHVPADVISKLLAERPAGVKGLAVAGMPMGSPDMEGDGSAKESLHRHGVRHRRERPRVPHRADITAS